MHTVDIFEHKKGKEENFGKFRWKHINLYSNISGIENLERATKKNPQIILQLFLLSVAVAWRERGGD